MNYLQALVAICLLLNTIHCAPPTVYYANVGDTVALRCTSGGGNYACFSTYAFQNQAFKMVYLNSSRKYQVSPGSIGVTNVQATDAGYYACSNDCAQMKIDQISYYLQPTQNGQPTDLGKQFLAIPPFNKLDEFNKDALYVVVLNEDENRDAAGLSTGEIVGLVIGCVFLFLITVTLVLLFIFLSRKQKQKREKMLELGKNKNEKDSTSVDYSTIERDVSDTDKNGEKKSLSSSRVNNNSSEINTKNIRGPNIYQPGSDLNQLNPKDLPSIDINSSKNNSQRSQQPIPLGSKQNSYNGSYQQNPSSRSYQNQLDNQIPRPNTRRDSDNGGILPPPPSKMPVNKIQFPSRNSSGSQQPQSNENLNNIIRESGLFSNVLHESPLDDVFGRNTDNYPFDDNQEQLRPNRHSSSGGIDLDSNGNGDGGVTVVSARTPLRNDSSSALPPAISRLPQPPSNKQAFQQQMRPVPNHLSYSQRIETTSTPLQVPPPSASLRAPFNGSKLGSNLKDGATDV